MNKIWIVEWVDRGSMRGVNVIVQGKNLTEDRAVEMSKEELGRHRRMDFSSWSKTTIELTDNPVVAVQYYGMGW